MVAEPFLFRDLLCLSMIKDSMRGNGCQEKSLESLAAARESLLNLEGSKLEKVIDRTVGRQDW